MKVIYCKEIEEYIEYVKNNPDEVDEDIKLTIKNVIIPTLERTDIFFDSKTYYKCLRFCEKWFYELYPYQKFIYAFFFMYEKEDNDIVVFPDIFVLMGRGNGKDGMIMPLACFLITPFYGIKMYNIDIVATSEEQAQNTFNVVYNMLEENKKIMKIYFVWNQTQIINRKTHSIIRYNTSSAKTKDGKQTGMIIFNEFHAYEDYKQINVFSSGSGKRKHFRTVTITTNGTVRDGPLDEKIMLSEEVERGEDNYLGLLPFLYRIKNKKYVDIPMKKFLETKDKSDIDITYWVQANPSIKFSSILKKAVIDDYLKMLKQKSYRSEFYAKRMNLPEQDEEDCAIDWGKILKASYSNVDLKIPRIYDKKKASGANAIIGIDFADLNDFASAGILIKINGEIIWRCHTWICSKSKWHGDIKFPFENKGQDGFQDFTIVDTESISKDEIVYWVLDVMSKYNVLKIVLDNYKYKLLEESFKKHGISIETKDNPSGIIRMVRYPASIAAIVAPMIELEFSEEKINIGNSAIMRWAINNTKIKIGRDGNKQYLKIEPKLRKNDPFMAFVVAFSVINLLEEKIEYVYI